MPPASEFRSGIRQDLDAFVRARSAELAGKDGEDGMRIDLHCHDRNSDVPDETLGRILRVPETWLPTAKLLRTLKANGADALTITNHNNARSCWQALERGQDILPAAEFSCTLPDFDVGVHILTFGFTPEQESKLVRLRKNLYRFLEYTSNADIPTVLAHPLFFYSPKGLPPLELMDRFALLFERFEGVNGQRDSWQNILTVSWLQGLDEEGIAAASRRTGIAPGTYCRNPLSKRITGGSDCHMGIFAGSTGTLLRVPGWRAQGGSRAALALEALRRGEMAPYGSHCEEEKLTVAFLDYFCQVALHMEDPGLIRLLLHRGTTAEKLQALAISNGMFELRRHKYTSKFLGLFHECLQGRKPGWIASLLTSTAYKPVLAQMDAIAAARAHSPERLVQVLREALPAMFDRLTALLADRVKTKVRKLEEQGMDVGSMDLLGKIELPTHFRALIGQDDAQSRSGEPAGIDLGKWSDGLPFPALASTILGGAAFAASKIIHGHRDFVQGFAERIGRYRHPRRALWLTDTLEDKNGVSHVLQATLAEARRRDLPIDFLACATGKAGGLSAGPHLRLLPAVSDFTLPFYPDQTFRLPGLLELQKTFLDGGYDRIIVSTEAPMGLFALYLKHAFNVPAYFYMHTDWMDFAKRTLKYDKRKLDRLRRMLRAFYRRFDGVFLLNTEQRDHFASPGMGLPADRLFLTAHWTDAHFHPQKVEKHEIFSGVAGRAEIDQPVLLYAGRLSEEKGVLLLPEIFRSIQARVPGAKMAFAGTGPCLERLREALPEADFLGWVPAEKLAAAYSAADLLLLPSWFDTFSCALLEALGCGLPAVAFNTKGPRDILSEGRGGLLAEGPEQMAAMAASLLLDPARLQSLRTLALRRATDFRAEDIMNRLIEDIHLNGSNRRLSDPSRKPESPAKPMGAEFGAAPNQAFIGELLSLMGG